MQNISNEQRKELWNWLFGPIGKLRDMKLCVSRHHAVIVQENEGASGRINLRLRQIMLGDDQIEKASVKMARNVFDPINVVFGPFNLFFAASRENGTAHERWIIGGRKLAFLCRRARACFPEATVGS